MVFGGETDGYPFIGYYLNDNIYPGVIWLNKYYLDAASTALHPLSPMNLVKSLAFKPGDTSTFFWIISSSSSEN